MKLRNNWETVQKTLSLEAHLQSLMKEQEQHLPLPDLPKTSITWGLCLYQQWVHFQPEKILLKASHRLLRERSSLNPRPEALIIMDLCESCQILPCSVIRAVPRVCFVSH